MSRRYHPNHLKSSSGRHLWLLACASLLAAHPVRAQNPAFPVRDVSIERSIGELPQSDDYRLAAISSVAVSPGGRIYTLDPGKFLVRVFDDSGKFLLKFGKKGAGNDEFIRPLDLIVDDTTVTVRDGGGTNGSGASARLLIFSLDGKHLRTRNISRDELARRTVTTRSGLHVDAWQTVPNTINAARKDPQYFIVTAQAASAKRADTLLKVRADAGYLETDSNGSLVVPGFGNGGTWSALGDSVVACVDGYSGVVKWYSLAASGATLQRTDSLRTVGPMVTPADVKKREAVINAAMMAGPLTPDMSAASSGGGGSRRSGGGGGGGGVLPSEGTLTNTPPQWSVATEAHFGSDGSLWVGNPRRTLANPRDPASITGPANYWIVFPRSGDPYQVELPLRFYIAGIHNGVIIGRSFGANGASSVAMYSVAGQ